MFFILFFLLSPLARICNPCVRSRGFIIRAFAQANLNIPLTPFKGGDRAT